MAKVKFYIKKREDRDPEKEYTINVFLQDGRTAKFKKSTGLKIIGKDWNDVEQAPLSESKTGDRNYYQLRRKLPELKLKIEQTILDANYKGETINSDWLTKVIEVFFGRINADTQYIYFTDYGNYFIDILPFRIQKNGTTGVSVSTSKLYVSTVNKILDFEKKKRKRFKLGEINLKFHSEFIQFLSKEQKLNLNTIGKYVKCLKTILKNAKQYGLKINPEVESDGFRSTKEDVYFVTLTNDEIDNLFNLDLSNTPYLDNARNWFIIGIWTGARVGDLLNFTNSNIHNGFLEYTSQKTKQKIILPIHWQVQSVIDRLGGCFPHKISNQRYNDWVKKVCQLAGIDELCKGSVFVTDKGKKGKKEKTPQRKIVGIYPKWKLISSHSQRRTFATIHYGVLPTPVIMSATGHTTEKQLLSYIGKTPQDNALIFQKYWEKEKIKQTKVAKLEVIKTAN